MRKIILGIICTFILIAPQLLIAQSIVQPPYQAPGGSGTGIPCTAGNPCGGVQDNLIPTNVSQPTGLTTNTGSGRITNPIAAGDLFQFISAVLSVVARLGAILVVFFIIYSGFLFVTAQGNEEKLKKAKQALLWTLVGAAILLGASTIALIVKNTISQLQ